MRTPIPPARNARTGAIRPGITTFSTIPEPITALDPSAANAEPTTPPISACEEDDGSPKYQVSRFQKIAPIRPAKSNASAVPTTIQRTTSLSISGVLDDDALEDVRARLAGVDRVLEPLEDVLPAD